LGFLPKERVPCNAAFLEEGLNALTERLAGYGMRPLTMTSAELGAMLRSDIERWGPVVKASGFTAED